MEKLFENPLLNDLYDERGEELENEYKKKYGIPDEEKRVDVVEAEFKELLKKSINDNEKYQEVFEMLNKLEISMISKLCFWYREYYKLGFIDAMRLKKEIS